jgi:hypothetical protein
MASTNETITTSPCHCLCPSIMLDNWGIIVFDLVAQGNTIGVLVSRIVLPVWAKMH